jgi:hypothetical protein
VTAANAESIHGKDSASSIRLSVEALRARLGASWWQTALAIQNADRAVARCSQHERAPRNLASEADPSLRAVADHEP